MVRQARRRNFVFTEMENQNKLHFIRQLLMPNDVKSATAHNAQSYTENQFRMELSWRARHFCRRRHRIVWQLFSISHAIEL